MNAMNYGHGSFTAWWSCCGASTLRPGRWRAKRRRRDRAINASSHPLRQQQLREAKELDSRKAVPSTLLGKPRNRSGFRLRALTPTRENPRVSETPVPASLTPSKRLKLFSLDFERIHDRCHFRKHGVQLCAAFHGQVIYIF